MTYKHVYKFQSPQQYEKQLDKQFQQEVTDEQQLDNMMNQINITLKNTYQRSLDINFQYLNRQYKLDILQKDLSFYKQKIQHKDKLINTNRYKLNKIKQQLNNSVNNLKLVSYKLIKIKKNYKILKKKYDKLLEQQRIQKNERLNIQQSKNNIYEIYGELEDRYRRAIKEIEDFNGIENSIQSVRIQNIQIQHKIEQISHKGQKIGADLQFKKKNLQEQARCQKQRIISLEKEQNNLLVHIEEIKRKEKNANKITNSIQFNNIGINKLYTNITQLKNNLSQKHREKELKVADYERVCREQNSLRKEMVIELNCRQTHDKYLEKSNQPLLKIIIDSQGQDSNFDQKKAPSPDLCNLIGKYEQIKSSNKQ